MKKKKWYYAIVFQSLSSDSPFEETSFETFDDASTASEALARRLYRMELKDRLRVVFASVFFVV